MNSIRLAPTIGAKTVLLIGFEQDFDQTLKHATTEGYPRNFQLSQVLRTHDSSKIAVICEAGFLQNDKGQLKQLVGRLTNIPCIIVDMYDNYSNKFTKDFDDFYTQPINWNMVMARLDNLVKLKPEIKNCIEKGDQENNFTVKISTSKRIFDIAVASFVLLLISPILLLVAILIKLESKGPVFYFSKRVGTGYEVFNFYKFRSMFVGADAKLAQLAASNQYVSTDGSALFVKIKDDPRITTIGKIIRKTSIDEFPQLINVLRGEMSIVGNRPLPLYEAEKLTQDEWSARFLAPGGLTGLWQVTKRGKSDMSVEERINLDIEYARNWSLWYDLKILFKTIPAMIQKETV